MDNAHLDRPQPLTHTNQWGDPYVRPGAIEAEIVAALGRPVSEWPARAQARGDGRWRSETVVYLARRLAATDERTLFGKLAYALSLRTAAVVARWARGLDDTAFELIAAEVDLDVITRLMVDPPTRQSEFLEVAFDLAVKRRTLQAVEAARRRPATVSLAPSAGEGDADICGAHEPACEDLSAEARLLAAEDHLLARKLLRAVIDRRHCEAYILHNFLGWPISSTDPATPCVARFFGVSDRQIRTWLRRAEADMREAIGAP